MNFSKFSVGASFLSYALIFTLLVPSTAHAYVDPGSGSVIVTTVLGFLAAVAFTFRKIFYKLFGKKNAEDDRSLDE